MTPLTTQLLLAAGILVVGGLLLIPPLFARRGLLFGVYVGEERWTGDEARRITRGWYGGMAAAIAICGAIGELLAYLQAGPAGALVAVIGLVIAGWLVFLRAHFRARALAVAGTPQAAAVLVRESPRSLLIPSVALAIAVAGGLVSLSYAWVHYGELPASFPTHFGASGRPDSWSPRSFWSVMLLPLAGLAIGTTVGIMACLIARAKRAIRFPDGGISVMAQMRFRRAMALFLSGLVVLVTAMLTVMSIYSIRTALGLASGLPRRLPVLVGALLTYAIGGSLYLAFRYGQGGARLERAAGGAPLTNGLADNQRWILGVFYVNRDDPSLLVERRFGLGYTLNFGNPKAIGLAVVFLIIVFAIILGGLLLPQTHVPPR